MIRRTITAACFSLMAVGVTLSGVDAAGARTAASPQLTGEQAKHLKERAERVQQRRKARVTQLQRQAVADRAGKAVTTRPVQQPAPAMVGKEVGQ